MVELLSHGSCKFIDFIKELLLNIIIIFIFFTRGIKDP